MDLSKTKRRIGAAVIAAMLGLPVQPECSAAKMIIIMYASFEPVGLVNEPGNQVTLTIVKSREGEVDDLGDSILYRITATQPATGASAFQESRIPVVPLANRPSGTQKISTAPDSPRFEPGPVEVSAEATHFSKDGQIKGTWSWSRTVELEKR